MQPVITEDGIYGDMVTLGAAMRLAEFSSDAAFVIDGERRILAWNARAEKLLGVAQSRAVGQYCYQLLSGRSANGSLLCGPHCAAAMRFRHDSPFQAFGLLSAIQGSVKMPVHLSSIVFPGQSKISQPKAIIFLRSWDSGSDSTGVGGETLRVRTLGSLRLEREGGSLEWRKWPRKQAVTLFKYLITRRGHPLHREELVEALWPESLPQEATGRLKVLIHSLRRYLEPHLAPGSSSQFVTTEGDCYRLVPGSQCWVDADWFQKLVQKGSRELESGDCRAALRTYEDARILYGGDYLEDDPYNDWFAPERERLRELYLSLLVGMASIYAGTGDYPGAIASCRAAVALDPCRESVQRLLMLYLWLAGHRTEALRQYRVCCEVLSRELGVAPLPETAEVYRRILNGAAPTLQNPG